ncbi:MAG: DUF3570 domain-containing protein [Gammaproteobacteria bacterium]|nr:DUF3570 domain-containing protein [Gammaproteobacteria bacterium]
MTGKKNRTQRKPGSGSKKLLALSTTALALPGIAAADAPPTFSTLSYKFTNYQEDDVSRREAPFGERERYDIDVHQLRLISPTGRNTSIQIDANQESMSGASPWFNTANADGDPIVNLSGASGIKDSRRELSIAGSYYLDNATLSASTGYSVENDYRSRYYGLSGQTNFNQDLTTVAVGVSYADDEIFPSDAELFNRVRQESKFSTSAFVSLSQIINQTSTFQTALSITEQSGFLSDPYKLRDVRPEQRTQLALTNSYRQFFVAADAALHINYRYYHDDFGISSHTLDAGWYQNLGDSIQLIPHLRYYSQSAADFYSNVDNFLLPVTEYQSSDYGLSSYGAISGGVNLVASLGDWLVSLNTERYIANEKYSAYDVKQPGAGLVRYLRISLGVEYSF